MEYARIRKEETAMDWTDEDLKRMGFTKKGKWQYTVDDIWELPEDVHVELIDGELFIWRNAPAAIHQDILMGLSFQVELYIQRKKGKCRVFPAPFGVQIKKDKYNFVLPDITLICDEDKVEEFGCYGAPDLVIEIVSPSNRKMDYVRKLALYKEAGVREYWIVDSKHKQVTVYDFEHDKEPVLHPFSERIKVGIYDDLYLDVLDRRAALEETLEVERKAFREKGHAEGIEEGHAEGHAKGVEEGIEEGLAEGHAEGHEEGHAEGLAEGEARFARLTAFLLREGRMDELEKALTDAKYREELLSDMEKRAGSE